MKKVMMVLLASLIATMGFSQSLTYMQGFDFNNGLNKPTQKLVADYFYTNAENNINVFSYNEWTIADNQGYGYMVLYGEYRIGNSNFWIHPETRFRVGDPTINPIIYPVGTNMANIGFAYNLNIGPLSMFFTPMYRYDFGVGHNWQFSINSSADLGRLYYESYIDTWGPDSFNFCTEQKLYYYFNNNIAAGVNLMLFNIETDVNFVPFACFRVSL